MNKTKTIVFLLIILSLLLLSVSALSAANTTCDKTNDITDNIDNIKKNTTIITKNEPKNLKTASKIYVSPNGNDKATGLSNNPYKTITNAIKNSKNNDEIVLNPGTYTITNTIRINMDKNIKITSKNKNNVIIQAKTSTNDLFFINAGKTLSISNVQFRNINRCSLFANKGTLTLTNVNFIQNSINKNANNRKAIINNYGKLTINRCDFNKNSGYNGSAVYNVADTTITNSNIKNGNALFGGAVYSHFGNVIIRNSNITSNTCNASFINGDNMDDYVVTGGLGGAIYNRASMEVYNSNLQYNKIPGRSMSVHDGGCIYNTGKLSLKNSRVLNTYTYGSGTIYNRNSISIINSTINNNIAEEYGGAILNEGFATITNSTINRNQGYRDVIANNYQMQLNNCIINTNNAEETITNNENLKMNNVTAMFNRGVDSGFIFNLGRLTLKSSKITQNSGKYVGAIESLGNMNIDKCLINGNHANNSGGAIECGNANITISNSQLNSNTAVYSGGAITFIDGNLTIRNTTLYGNKVGNSDEFFADYTYGGAIFMLGGTTKIINSLLHYNSAECGGAIGIHDGTLLVNVTNFYGNNANVVGGAISTYYGENEYKPYIKLYKVNIKYNYAKNGSHAISDNGLGHGATIDMKNTNINSNGRTSSREDNCVLTFSGRVTMDDVQIKYNNATVMWSCANLTIKNSMISSNVQSGGNMMGYFGKTVITNSRIRDNVGKNIFYTYVGQFIGSLSITNSTIYNPRAQYEIYNGGELSQLSTSNVKCENNWWGTKSKPTKLYNCKVTSYNKGLK